MVIGIDSGGAENSHIVIFMTILLLSKERQKLNYKICVILMQKGIVVFVFANYLDNVLVWNYTISGFNGGIEKA
jgi:hypothetical protein